MTWKPRSMIRAREKMAAVFGMGQIELDGPMPSGHHGTLMPERMFFVKESRAVLNGVDLGRPAKLRQNPRIGGVPLPARGVMAMGQAVWPIRDHAEFERLRADCAAVLPL